MVATDPETGKTAAKQVTALHLNDDTELTSLVVVEADGSQSVIETTWHHRFWSKTRRAWVNAADLAPGEALTTVDDRSVTVGAVDNRVGDQPMHDLTVADIHTYYVLAGNTPVLVHNDGGGGLQDNIRLYGDYTARMDQFNVRGQASFEIHVYHRGTEVGIYGSNGFFNKHNITASDVNVPDQVHNRLKGIAVDQMRKIGQIPAGANIKGDAWKRPMIGSSGGGC